MLLWYAAVSVVLVHTVFRSVGIDYRLVALGSVLPLLVDLPWGRQAVGHTLAFPVVLMAVIMFGTIGRRRLLRRRLLCIPIGVFVGVLLSAAWQHAALFWWPAFGWSFPDVALLPVWWILVIEEAVGLFALWWIIGLGTLYEAGPRREFLRTGRLGPLGGSPPVPPPEGPDAR